MSENLNQVAIDWLTCTFYEEADQWDNVQAIIKRVVSRYKNSRVSEAKRLQYVGTVFYVEDGTIFLGSGRQRSRKHNLLQISGSLAQIVWDAGINRLVFTGYLSVTRFDIQATVAEPATWSQAALFDRLRQREPENISFIQSKTGGIALSTVYYGRRAGESFLRIYEKLGLGEDKYLRFEVELKGNLAHSVAVSLAREKLSGYWMYYFQKVGDGPLSAVFTPVIVGAATKPAVFRPERATAAWLEGQVYQALAKYLAKEMPDAERVAEKFQALLSSYWAGRYTGH